MLIVGQTEAWVSGTLQALSGAVSPKNLEVEDLPAATVRDVLLSVAELRWLASDGEAVSALTNLRDPRMGHSGGSAIPGAGLRESLSLPAIADRLWVHWTDNKPSVQRLVVRLAEREAAFEHSFAISQLESGETAVLDALPTACPMRRDERSGRIRFQHDLAADWVRFQRLKEISDDTGQWALLAANPFWHGALRMLGQFLLRQRGGSRSAWDVAFEAAEQGREVAPLADDVLLDALFLDPNAETFLDERADVLFANNAARLLRLAKRFEYVASVPGADPDVLRGFRDLSLYFEAHFRTPIFGRWPAMARFLAKYRDRIAKLTSPTIASLCDRWLTTTPPVLPNGVVTSFRREFAELALAGAREMQLGLAKGIIYLGEREKPIYQAAFAGAPDLPTDVSEWALEMAQRRPYRADIVERVGAHRIEQAAEHRRRLETDADYRERYERKRSAPTSISSRTRLPPWPLGARCGIEHEFRDAVLRSAAFQALMRTNATVAGEVLLARIIEDEPKRRNSVPAAASITNSALSSIMRAIQPRHGRVHSYAFLHINPDAALSCLHRLINFSTERWVHAIRQRIGSDPETLSLRLTDGTVHPYAGDYRVFCWSQQNSASYAADTCALAALERWLCDLVDTGVDVAPWIEALLRATNSVAVLGVLVNVGKHRDELLKGPLRLLLGSQDMYEWGLASL